MSPVLAQLTQDFPEDIRLIYRHFPLGGHNKALQAAYASEAAGLQGEFWAFHDLLYEEQADWSTLSASDFDGFLKEAADRVGLDVDKFWGDLNSEEIKAKVESSYNEAIALELPGTPSILIDGSEIPSNYFSYENLSLILEKYFIPLGNLTKIQYSECPDMSIDPDKQYTATIQTDIGDITLALYPEVAPFAVNSFIFLAENHFYDGISFHRVIKDFMAQSGDPSGTGAGNPGYFFSLEVSPEFIFDREGLLAMANAGPTSNGSQFFITYSPQPHLNGNYTIFGEVIEGMEVVQALSERDPNNLTAPEGNTIITILIHSK